ncbi:MAG: hypothetical protein ABIB71_00435 [Candidatus Woesearchaeota archaeon]
MGRIEKRLKETGKRLKRLEVEASLRDPLIELSQPLSKLLAGSEINRIKKEIGQGQ